TTLAGLRAMDRALPERLKKFPGVPQEVVMKLDNGASEPDLVKLLEATPDAGEPSLAALGRMVADCRFALAYLRARFIAYSWNVPVGDFLDESWPKVADHPYHGALEAMRIDPRGDVPKFNELMGTVDIPDIGFNEYVFSYQVGMADIRRHEQLNRLI